MISDPVPQPELRKAVFPVGGLGTRFLPATKATPKEMLPVVDKPLVQYAVEEAYAAGVREMIFVTGRNKRSIEDHFDVVAELEAELEAAGKHALRALLDDITPPDMVCLYVRQPRPLGLGHAVACAAPLVGNAPFAVLLADDLMVGEPPVLQQMAQQHARLGGHWLAVQDVPREETRRYGIVSGAALDAQVVQAQGLVEKPHPDQAPSTLAVAGRYILGPSVFTHLARQQRGAGGEIQLTDAIAAQIGTEPVYALRYQGTRYDCGS
ncbi:MAG: UTP--glucose-1-phosphate uridylyltransferase GalU, partial [Burkholderiaceae bacterium]